MPFMEDGKRFIMSERTYIKFLEKLLLHLLPADHALVEIDDETFSPYNVREEIARQRENREI